MRSAPLVHLCLGFAAAAFSACVKEDPVPAYVGVEYQVRCLGDCSNRPDSPVRKIYAVDGERDLAVRCDLDGSGDSRVLTFRASCPGDDAACSGTRYEFAISKLAVNSDGDPGSACEVAIREGSNLYETGCTGGELNRDNRCKIDFEVDAAASEVTGTLRCLDIPNASAPTDTRYVVEPDSDDKVFEFVAQGCTGLE